MEQEQSVEHNVTDAVGSDSNLQGKRMFADAAADRLNPPNARNKFEMSSHAKARPKLSALSRKHARIWRGEVFDAEEY